MNDLICILLQVFPVIVLCYIYVAQKYSFWSRRNVPGPRPIFPLGYQFQKAFADPITIEHEWTRRYGPVYGVYTGLIPTLTITDADLIKQVLIRDFHLFIDRRALNSSHEIWNQNLFNAESDNWKRIRSIVSPAFSSGKLRGMYAMMGRCVDQLVEHIDSSLTTDIASIDIKQVITGFTIDVIASTSFATETNANKKHSESQSRTSFVANGRRFFDFNPLKLAAVYSLPRWLLKCFQIRTIFPDDSLEFFVNLSRNIIQNRRHESVTSADTINDKNFRSPRQNSSSKRTDLLQLLMDLYVYDQDLKGDIYDRLTVDADKDDQTPPSSPTANKSHDQTEMAKYANESITSNTTTTINGRMKRTLTEKEIVAQCMIFFVAGFETTAATISHAIFNLVKNLDIQERLYRELIKEEGKAAKTTTGTETFNDGMIDPLEGADLISRTDRLLRLPYLDAIIKETLRMYPPIVRIERRLAVDDYKLGGIPLAKDVLVEVPTVSVHYNDAYYPDPYRFDPDRFMPANRDRLVPYTFLPFGAGPRNCVGARFAYQEIKMCISALIRRYRFLPAPGTPEKLQFLNGSIMLNSKSFPVTIERR